ncbi:four helix bundle protein [Ferruginibacter profundus]
MATITSFEDLDIWKKAIDLGVMVYELSENNIKIAKDFSFKDQVKRAAQSVSNNIAEGFEYSNNNDFWRFLRIAKGSCGEVRSCLLFSIRVKYTTNKEVDHMIEFARLLGSQIGNMMKYLRANKAQQSKKQN